MDYVHIGTIKGTHGIKGEVKVESNSDFKSERFKKGNKLYLGYNNTMVGITIHSYRVHNNYDLITFNGIDNINDVLGYIGCNIYVIKSLLPPLPENEFYFHELIGLDAVTDIGEGIGKVIEVRESPQGALLIIKKPNDSEAIIPFVKAFIRDVDVDKKKITITPIEGLL